MSSDVLPVQLSWCAMNRRITSEAVITWKAHAKESHSFEGSILYTRAHHADTTRAESMICHGDVLQLMSVVEALYVHSMLLCCDSSESMASEQPA